MNGSRQDRSARRLRQAGLKATGPRIAILAQLEEDSSHPTAEGLLEQLRGEHPSMSLSTVYKTLEIFLRAGLCRRVAGDGARLRVDGTLADHDHAACRVCGRIFDVDCSLLPRPDAPAELPDGSAVTAVHVEYEVICLDCETHDALASRTAATRPPSPADEVLR
jgi:Fe2+ or Zn2+ uptake regulation protein